MQDQLKPSVVVSKCLDQSPCRWDGLLLRCETVRELRPYVRLIPVCPETGIGLGVPRDPLRLVQAGTGLRLIQCGAGRDLGGKMRRFIAAFCRELPPIDGFILKARSPSCGYGDAKIYPSGQKTAISSARGSGIFACALQKRFPYRPMESESGLENPRRRKQFLLKIFTLAGFRQVKKNPGFKALAEFHSLHENLFKAYSQKGLKCLADILFAGGKKPLIRVLSAYERELEQILCRTLSNKILIQAVQHLPGLPASLL